MTDHHQAVPVIPVETEPEVVVDLPCETGEGPLWDELAQVLYWLDIPPGRLYRFDPESMVNRLVYEHDAAIGGATLQGDGSLLLFCSFGKILHLNPATGQTRTIVDRIDAEAESRFNDVEADPLGGVFCGTMPTATEPARLYRLDRDGSLQLLYDDLGLSNGIGFSPDETRMYHSDTNTRRLYAFDYDQATGSLANRQILIANPPGEGYPDGMTVDSDGNLWIARWDGKSVYRHSPDGTCTGRVRFPVRKVSSIAFGGARFEDAYVSTAAPDGRNRSEGMLAGSLFRVKLPAKGKPPYRSQIGL